MGRLEKGSWPSFKVRMTVPLHRRSSDEVDDGEGDGELVLARGMALDDAVLKVVSFCVEVGLEHRRDLQILKFYVDRSPDLRLAEVSYFMSRYELVSRPASLLAQPILVPPSVARLTYRDRSRSGGGEGVPFKAYALCEDWSELGRDLGGSAKRKKKG